MARDRRSPTGGDTHRRQLLLGLPGAALSAHLLKEPPGAFWIWPTALARDAWIAARAEAGVSGPGEQVLQWSDLWAIVRAAGDNGPCALGPAGVRATLRAAIDSAAREGELDAIGELATSPGFRRRLTRRIAAWRRADRGPAGPPPIDRPVEAAEWRIYARYRALLQSIAAEDTEGLALWAAKHLRDVRPAPWRGDARIILVDPPDDRATLRAIDVMIAARSPMLVALPHDETRITPFAESNLLVQRLEHCGFHRHQANESAPRPLGLATLEAGLFRDGLTPLERSDRAEGLELIGQPAGEGVARAVAQRVARRLDAGHPPDDVLIVIRDWDDQAEQIQRTLRAWGIPVAARDECGLRNSPSLHGLRLALRLEEDGWDADSVARLIRHGRFRPRCPGYDDNRTRALAAASVRDARVFRGLDALIEVLRRQSAEGVSFSSNDPATPDFSRRLRLRRAEQARTALPLVEWLGDRVRSLRPAATWAEQVGRLIALAADLGLASIDDRAFAELIDALDEQGEVQAALAIDRLWYWWPFVAEVESLVREHVPEPPGADFRGVRLATVEQARGACAGLVVVAALAEGTFPRRSSIRVDPIETPSEVSLDESFDSAPDQLRLAFDATLPPATPLGREMLAFLRLVAAARDQLALVYPTSDEKGNRLLPAAFLDDVRDAFDREALRAITIEQARLDPSLLDAETLDPSERRVRAAARAALRHEFDELKWASNAEGPNSFAQSLLQSVLLSMRRRRGQRLYTHFEGMLRDHRAIARISSEFGPEFTFSASQLESLVHCPFQFFARYVLRLDPVDERDELDEDRTLRGHRIHSVLQQLHEDAPSDPAALLEYTSRELPRLIEREVERECPPSSPVAFGLQRIEAERMKRSGRLYVQQLDDYVSSVGSGSACARCELRFGPELGPDGSDLSLRLGEGDASIRLQGSIDRVDLLDRPEGPMFRVIDYKTSGTPASARVRDGIALQLPLYALAVERLGLLDTAAEPLDVGYWSLRREGFKVALSLANPDSKGRVPAWPDLRDGLVALVLDWAARLRGGSFPVRPSTNDCARACDYAHVCRIGQVRAARKEWPAAPVLRVDS